MRAAKAHGWESYLALTFLLAVVVGFGLTMGFTNFFSTVMRTSYDLLINTVFYIMAISVLAGAFGGYLAEFGILSLLNRLMAPAVRRIWGMPGIAAIGALSTFLSDNPAISTLGRDKDFIKYFSDRQRAALTNFGTSFGMGLIIITFCMSRGFYREALVGLAGAVIGSIFSTRAMLALAVVTVPALGTDQARPSFDGTFPKPTERGGNLFDRFLQALLDGGRNGLETSFQMIPGVLVICTMVLMLTLGPGKGYDGSSYQGAPLFPWLALHLDPVLQWMFGLSSPDAIVFPVTALGSVGAALGMLPKLIQSGVVHGNDIVVFVAMGICWSGFLSSHASNMSVLGFRRLVGSAMGIQALAGLLAGIAAHYLWLAFR